MTPHLSALLWQVPAIFTAVPMVHRLLPFKLPERAIGLFYVIVSVVVMALPGSLCLALAAAGLVSYLHNSIGVRLAAESPPDMAEVANKLALTWDYIVTHLPVLPVKGQQETIVHDDGEDSKEPYQEPPSPPEDKIRKHIPSLD